MNVSMKPQDGLVRDRDGMLYGRLHYFSVRYETTPSYGVVLYSVNKKVENV